MARGKDKRVRLFTTVNLPRSLVMEVGRVVEELGYWPAKTHFMHEAVMEKLEWAKREIDARKSAK
jgi:hypothetical protein